MSTFNFDCSTSLTFFDKENKMVLRQNHSWNPDGDLGKGDAIGRNLSAMEAWGEEEIEVARKTMKLQDWLMEGIMDCWVLKKRRTWLGRLLKGKYYYQGYRYPTYARGEEEQRDGLSRDHTLNTVLAMLYMQWDKKDIWNFVKKLKFRISPFALMTINLWLWLRVVSGRRIARLFYYPIEWITVSFTSWWQRKVEKITGIGPHYEVPQDEFKYMQNKDKPKIVDTSCGLLYPVYAMKQAAEQFLYVNEKWGTKLRNKYIKITPTYNYVIQLLLKDPNGPTEKDIMNYKPMRGSRWTGVFNKWWNKRSLKVISEGDPLAEYNQLDVDYARSLYEKYKIN